jgi:histidinol-phosphate aminotransferase
MGLVSDRIALMRGYVPGEQPPPGKFVKLNTNENPYPPSPRVAEAVTRAAAGPLQLYPAPMADDLRTKAAERYGLRAEQVLVGNGSDEILAICLRACVGEGDSIAFTVPTYSLYRTLAAIAGARIRTHVWRGGPLPVELAARGPRVVFVCTPNSPTGLSVPVDEVARLATASDALVVADEAYVDFADASALAILDAHPNLLVVRTLSKSFSLAGVRLGLAFGDASLIAELAKVKDSYNVSRLDLAAGVAALDDYAWMEANVARIRTTRDRVVAELRRRKHLVTDSSANFFWLDCGDRGGRSVYERLRERGILVRHFDDEGLREGVRVTVGTDDEMDRLLVALAEI